MNSLVIIFVAIGLSMDCFAVSVASGCAIARIKLKHALRVALFFGFFQMAMPVVGWLAGRSLLELICDVDHWVAFALLGAVGGKMIYESTRLGEEPRAKDTMNPYVLLMLSIATSIDALAIGITLSFLKVAIMAPALIIGFTAFALSFAGMYIGKKFGHFFEKRIEIAGGLILIGIGIKILIEHLSG